MRQSQILIRPVGSSAVYRRRHHYLESSSTSSSSRGRIAEVAGGTAAECTAVWCCAPCTLVNLVVLAVYKVPAGICRKTLRKHKRQRMIKKGMLPLAASSSSALSSNHDHNPYFWDDLDQFHYVELGSVPEAREVATVVVVDQDLMDLEKEMWDKFYSAGFWRSPSQKEHQQ